MIQANISEHVHTYSSLFIFVIKFECFYQLFFRISILNLLCHYLEKFYQVNSPISMIISVDCILNFLFQWIIAYSSHDSSDFLRFNYSISILVEKSKKFFKPLYLLLGELERHYNIFNFSLRLKFKLVMFIYRGIIFTMCCFNVSSNFMAELIPLIEAKL